MTTKVNPAEVTNNFESFGRDIQFITIDYTVAVNGSAGPLGAQNAIRNTLMTEGTIVAMGPLLDSNTQQTVAFEGGDSVNVTTMQASLRALGTVDGVDLSSTEVHATKLGILDTALVS